MRSRDIQQVWWGSINSGLVVGNVVTDWGGGPTSVEGGGGGGNWGREAGRRWLLVVREKEKEKRCLECHYRLRIYFLCSLYFHVSALDEIRVTVCTFVDLLVHISTAFFFSQQDHFYLWFDTEHLNISFHVRKLSDECSVVFIIVTGQKNVRGTISLPKYWVSSI